MTGFIPASVRDVELTFKQSMNEKIVFLIKINKTKLYNPV